jgi:AcrR family transcriptional regulator
MPSSTRDRIIEASTALFMERGFTGSGLKQIAIESGATIGSLYHFFPGGKGELAAETLRASGAAYQALVEAVFDGEPDLVSGVRAGFAGAAATLRETDYADACPVATVALEVASSDEPLRMVTAEIFESWLQAGTRLIAAAGIEPQRARQLATVLIAALEGGFLLSRAAKDSRPMDAIGVVLTELFRAELERAPASAG